MKVKMNIYAGGAWEGHVVYKATHPEQSDVSTVASSLEEINHFCEKYNLEMDEVFVGLVKKHLAYEQNKGLVVPNEFVDEYIPVSSANNYLKKYFSDYY
jgi:hypothetical protein